MELLTDEEQYRIIRWVNKTGEFALLDREEVAKLWGEGKNNDDMNYEKLIRSLRYYFESKHKGHKRFSIMQKGEESSIKYNYRFTKDGLAKLCHHIGWEQVRRYAVTVEQQQGLDQLQVFYLQKMKAPSPAKGGPAATKVPQATLHAGTFAVTSGYSGTIPAPATSGGRQDGKSSDPTTITVAATTAE